MENLIKMDDLGENPIFSETSIYFVLSPFPTIGHHQGFLTFLGSGDPKLNPFILPQKNWEWDQPHISCICFRSQSAGLSFEVYETLGALNPEVFSALSEVGPRHEV